MTLNRRDLLRDVAIGSLLLPAVATPSSAADTSTIEEKKCTLLGKGILISGQVPLAETFGYATDLRSLTQGQGTFTLELHTYRRVPASIQQAIIVERAEQKMAPA